MRAGGGEGVVGGGSSAGRFHRWSGQCVGTKSSSRDVPPLICSDARDRPFGPLWLRWATACDRAPLLERKMFVRAMQRHV